MNRPAITLPLATLAIAVAISACAAKSEAPLVAAPTAPGPAAYAKLLDAQGSDRARAVLMQGDGFVELTVLAEGVSPGTHAVHIHTVGRCTPPDFMSAGPHFNPTGAAHGAHKGDLPNIEIGADGKGQVTARVDGIALSGGDSPILDADGAAVVIHQNADDFHTDPAGNAGPRLACGVIVTN